MIRGHELGTVVCVEASPEARDPLLGPQECLGGKGPKAADDLGPDGLQLFEENGEAGLDLIGSGIAILRRAAFHNVSDVYLLSLQVYGLNDAGEEFSCPTDKRFALQILFSTRPLSHKDEGGMGVARAEDKMVSTLIEPTPGTLTQFLSDSIEVQVFSPIDLSEEGVDAQFLVIVHMPLQLGDELA